MSAEWEHDAQAAVAAVRMEAAKDPDDPELAVLVGDLTLDCDTWNSPDGSGQRLMILTAEPGTPSHDRLRILASWAAQAPALQPAAGTAAQLRTHGFAD